MTYRRLEEISQNASRPERGLMIDGWSVGLSPGLAKRSRCVNAFYASQGSFEHNLAASQAVFAKANLPCIFRLTPFVSDPSLDEKLQQAGFTRFDTTLVQTVVLDALDVSNVRVSDLRFSVATDFTQAAIEVGSMRGDSATEVAALALRWQHCAAKVEPLFAYDGNGIRVARSVAISEDGYVGIFDVGTATDQRGQGYATALLAHQLQTARAAGAHTAYLQVTPENTSRRIYERFGFRTAYEYWYRALPADLR